MRKWLDETASNVAAERINRWMTKLLGERSYDRIVMPAIVGLIAGITRKWN